ncbi:MAG: preprotein translocase subunit SecG [Candidatus Woykebacteria bacterium RIFCSPHIGHO2_01_FULL_39_12]|uniref:Protein-export membrane protein SecG n=2 Tax=Candidatus Woykeibacteriota TaxID=1817899 RepID=A0A1G1WE07_9BACT|nr:MAG: preprotein translocase subunit SecG [Candidatus Woykebacteria bacterium RBG_16_39_9b]OGY27593.1 MAG: preprotein translocase subunit SecG [Candidatus Woykebacteria bacterium RIFCSPHIGHO2_01_FULL_39_12]
MKEIILIFQVLVSISLVIVILLQQRGTGVGAAFGGGGAVYRSKRGVEKLLYYTTIILGIIFAALALSFILII